MRGMFLSDEELGKKDDDHKKHGRHASLNHIRATPSWAPSRPPRRSAIKTFAVVAALVLLVILFIRNIPSGLGPNPGMRRPNYVSNHAPPDGQQSPDHIIQRPPPRAPPAGQQQQQPPPQQQKTDESASPDQNKDAPLTAGHEVKASPAAQRDVDGPVRFLDLARSLYSLSSLNGGFPQNQHVLFAAGSLKSTSTLLPMACQMGTNGKNHVHFALMGRSQIALDELQRINGIDESCKITFHDARVELAPRSTDHRMERAVFRALHHINTYMHPQAIIVDGSDDEDTFFPKSAELHSRVAQTTLIAIPKNPGKRMDLITKMSSAALKLWHKTEIDILVHAPSKSSGSLIRLLKSLSEADYAACSIPHLTIELPHEIDPPTKRFLEDFSWPPEQYANPTNARTFTLRHRVPRQSLNEDESSTRFLESFWPAHPQTSHVLVLSPQAELSPQFLHYLKYTLLEGRDDTRLMGISLEQPRRLLDGQGTLMLPSKPGAAETDAEGSSTPFLWQAPSSGAMLYKGERWVELHDFVSKSLDAKRRVAAEKVYDETRKKESNVIEEKSASTQHPAWLEHALRLARARGYWTLYPGLELAAVLAKVHAELAQAPEEYAGEGGDQAGAPKPLRLEAGASDAEADAVLRRIRGEGEEISLVPGDAASSVLDALPDDLLLGNGQDAKLPLVGFGGRSVDLAAFNAAAAQFASRFRREAGGCGKGSGSAADDESAARAAGADDNTSAKLLKQDLFCE